MEVKVLHFS